MATTNVITGAVKSKNLPNTACFTNFTELLQSLEQYLTVEIPTDSISGVVVSVEQPSRTDVLWIRRDPSGVIIGGYVYSSGKWVALFPPPNQIFWMYGDSRTPPPGYAVITQGDGTFSTAQFAQFVTQYIADPSGTYFVYYATKFIGV